MPTTTNTRLNELEPKIPLLESGHDYATLTDKIAEIVDTKPHPKAWFVLFACASFGVLVLLYSLTLLFAKGVGIWGIMIPVGWGWDIINFVWWIGIGHAGTLISAILLLFYQDWRTSINRFAEAMTLFAVVCAGMYPIIHMGRPWVAYFILPYPNSMALWPQFRSPLVWDVFAISTYATVSLLFWYTGLVPDLAAMRDRAKNKVAKYAFGILSLGWRGSARHWSRYETAYLLLAGLSMPLVVSVHSVVSFDFAVGIIPGWHTTIFPPYFVAGAVYAGFAMVLILAIPIRRLYNLKDMITMKHIDNMAKVMLVTGLVVFYGYIMEAFFAWYSGSLWEREMLVHRTLGYYKYAYWALIVCNGLCPQLLWFSRVRNSTYALFAISLVVSVGMWLERYVIIVTSLARDYLPSSWGNYHGTVWDKATFFGTIGLFLFLFLLFVRFVPMISAFELKMLLDKQKKHGKAH
ncbi:MAG: NrfD/PsrC family molybdoenzyme membrane anchor subunit [Candidatus Hydrogenedentes bacterium]|nr:NrfD/PsrC family molybdoenzyme membrane anchor subunit [Candidatus Hydrogenedentota bacterium]